MDKLERHIRKTLQQREIKPAPRSWDRISEQLDQKKRRNALMPIGIAASLIGLLILGFRFLLAVDTIDESNSIDHNIEATQMVESEVEIKELDIKGEVQISEIDLVNTKTKEKTPVLESNEQPEIGLVGPEIKGEEVAEYATINKDESGGLNKINVSEEAIASSVEGLLAEVLAIENDSIQMTDAEIDSLLFIAQKQLLAERMSPDSAKREIDAMALLNEVELELFETERNQLFDRLRESFFKLRTAVADRNK